MNNTYSETIVIDYSLARKIDEWMKEPQNEDECLGVDFTYTETVRFENGMEADIKLCGVDYEVGTCNIPWTEMVLFKNGSEVACTDVADDYFGMWEIEYNGDTYEVYVVEEN